MDPAQIEPKLRRAKRRLALRRFLLGRTHRATGDAYYQTGTLLRLTGEMDGAAHCLSMAERIHRKRLGPGHPAVAIDLFSIGEYQAQWGERRRALQSYERAERILEVQIKQDPSAQYPLEDGISLRIRLAYVLSNMGGVLRELELTGKARSCYERALRIVLDDLGPGSDDARHLARNLLAIGVDPLVVAREQGGEPAATALATAYRAAHGTDPLPEPMS